MNISGCTFIFDILLRAKAPYAVYFLPAYRIRLPCIGQSVLGSLRRSRHPSGPPGSVVRLTPPAPLASCRPRLHQSLDDVKQLRAQCSANGGRAVTYQVAHTAREGDFSGRILLRFKVVVELRSCGRHTFQTVTASISGTYLERNWTK